MARHFGPQNMRNGYSAMGKSRLRPIYAGCAGKSVAEAIAAERAKAARMAKANTKKAK